ncbi:isochorismatase [Legionella nautarum]|uniref:Isochorismatase n=1 Tax=Legionella nautarum TaxID=45070 RepID=A0A0W0WIN0_9GAMM|nr:isochorismatase family protein [Legionella nautarum]KTD32183.1 isochorismatase [Legionella nautarum]
MNYTIDLEQIREYNTHHFVINPKRAALIVIEMQNVFLTDLKLISDRQINNIKSIIEASEKAGVKTIYVRHNDSSEISKSMIEWWGGDKIEYGSEGWKMLEGFNTTGKTIIDKNQYSAFFKTNLDNILQENNITDVIVVGVMANCCCETTARDAFMHGYKVFFISDATSTLNEDLHLSAIKNLSFGFACIKNTSEIINDLNYDRK